MASKKETAQIVEATLGAVGDISFKSPAVRLEGSTFYDAQDRPLTVAPDSQLFDYLQAQIINPSAPAASIPETVDPAKTTDVVEDAEPLPAGVIKEFVQNGVAMKRVRDENGVITDVRA